MFFTLSISSAPLEKVLFLLQDCGTGKSTGSSFIILPCRHACDKLQYTYHMSFQTSETWPLKYVHLCHTENILTMWQFSIGCKKSFVFTTFIKRYKKSLFGCTGKVSNPFKCSVTTRWQFLFLLERNKFQNAKYWSSFLFKPNMNVTNLCKSSSIICTTLLVLLTASKYLSKQSISHLWFLSNMERFL